MSQLLSFLNRRLTKLQTNYCIYSKTCVKPPHSKRPKIGFHDQLLCLMQVKSIAEGKHSVRLLNFIKLPFVVKIFVVYFSVAVLHMFYGMLLFLFVCFNSLCPSQQFFSYVGTGLPRLNQY